ncbi:MAG: sugar phosphate isomerase/epimerase [Chloroflexi bacterium]|nr:sugar phosphate isomerase/epimerase [Chloroflexota bacterium]
MLERIALQLYTVRDVASEGANGYEKAVRQIAEMGYRAVETAGFPGTTPEAANRLFTGLGLTVAAVHAGDPLGENKTQVLEMMEALGKPALINTRIGPHDVESMDSIRRLCDRLNEGFEVAKANGFRFGVHNHWWEFERTSGIVPNEVMRELLNPEIFFEIDTYWVKVGGSDPAAVVRELGIRAPFLHIKDGPCNSEQPQTAVGDGVMDIPAVIKAGGDNTEWLIVEMDSVATDVMEAVKKSYDYLKTILTER